MKEEIIYENGKPKGIRDSGGCLFFFTDIHKYTGQEERYRKDVADQYKLADDLLQFLKERAALKEPVQRADNTGSLPCPQFNPGPISACPFGGFCGADEACTLTRQADA